MEAPTSEALNIGGLVVSTRPDDMDRVASALSDLPGVEVHGASPEGRLVVTVDLPGENDVAATLHHIRDTDGVLAASVVYSHIEPVEAGAES
ncbi:MAG: chaperone NapD [Alphaproteobacteria bacterium]|nr:chaperone NapD [Alphaproteobacteria bacterium]